MITSTNTLRTAALMLGVLLATLSGGCGNHAYDDPTRGISAEELLKRGQRSLNAGAYQNSVRYFNALETRFPFAPEAQQAKLNIIYAHYKLGEPDLVEDAANDFIRENPRDPSVDYAYYLKGLVYFESGPNLVERMLRVHKEGRPPGNAEKAFEHFSALVQRFPDSEYAEDARQRMVFLRNRLAGYEVAVARYYYKRGAYMAAVSRAERVLESFQGSDFQVEALELLVKAYEKLELDDLARDTRRVLESNNSG